MATLPSNEIKDLLGRAIVDFASDTFDIILMVSGFAFDRVNHDVLADVTASQLPTANGYTSGGVILAGVTLTRNDTTNFLEVTWNNASWTATGGDIVSQGAIIFDNTVAAPVVDPIVGYIDFGSALTAFDTGPFTVSNITFRI